MRKLIYAALLTVSSLFVGCGNSDIESWNSSMVWFADTLINFTNMAQPDVPMGGTLKIPVPLTIASEVATIIRKTKCSRSAKRNDIFAKRNVYVFSSL